MLSKALREYHSYLDGLPHELGIIFLYIMVRPDWSLEFVADDHTRALCARPAQEQHDARSSIGECALNR